MKGILLSIVGLALTVYLSGYFYLNSQGSEIPEFTNKTPGAHLSTPNKHPSLYTELHREESFSHFVLTHQRKYTTRAEKTKRYSIFKDNFNKISEYNSNAVNTATLGLNQFADITQKEYREEYLGTPHNVNEEASPRTTESSTSPKYIKMSTYFRPSINWREVNKVTEPKNQILMKCASGWAFSTIGALESLKAIHLDSLVPLSEQQLLDCDRDGTNYGCIRGHFAQAYEYAIKKGIMTAEDYPYHGETVAGCKYNLDKVALRVGGYHAIPHGDNDAVINALSTNPVSAAMDASSYEFMFYRGGIYIYIYILYIYIYII